MSDINLAAVNPHHTLMAKCHQGFFTSHFYKADEWQQWTYHWSLMCCPWPALSKTCGAFQIGNGSTVATWPHSLGGESPNGYLSSVSRKTSLIQHCITSQKAQFKSICLSAVTPKSTSVQNSLLFPYRNFQNIFLHRLKHCLSIFKLVMNSRYPWIKGTLKSWLSFYLEDCLLHLHMILCLDLCWCIHLNSLWENILWLNITLSMKNRWKTDPTSMFWCSCHSWKIGAKVFQFVRALLQLDSRQTDRILSYRNSTVLLTTTFPCYRWESHN